MIARKEPHKVTVAVQRGQSCGAVLSYFGVILW